MPTSSSDPAALYKQLAQTLGVEAFQTPLGQGWPPPFHVEVVSNVEAFATTYTEGSGRLMNGIVLVHDLVLRPSFGPNGDIGQPRVTDYWVYVEPVRDGGRDVQPAGPDGRSPGAFTTLPGKGDYQEGPLQNPDNGLLASSFPGTTEGATQFSTGGSHTFGGSIGFFGDSPTATATDSTTVSWGTSTSIPDVRIQNLSDERAALVHYIVGASDFPPFVREDDIPSPVSVSQTTFQPELSQLFLFPDTQQKIYRRKGVKADEPSKDAYYQFRVLVMARAVCWTQTPESTMMGFKVQPTFFWGWGGRDVIVQQPPLPGQVKAT